MCIIKREIFLITLTWIHTKKIGLILYFVIVFCRQKYVFKIEICDLTITIYTFTRYQSPIYREYLWLSNYNFIQLKLWFITIVELNNWLYCVDNLVRSFFCFDMVTSSFMFYKCDIILFTLYTHSSLMKY